MDDPLVTDDAKALVADLTVNGQSVATAESLTGGLLAATLAGVPGASAVLHGGLVTYTEDTKIWLAGVAPQVLDAVGPVAAPTARALAVGARQRCAATWGVSLTGVAGPEAHGGHPPGTVFLGLAGPVDTEVVELTLSVPAGISGWPRSTRRSPGCVVWSSTNEFLADGNHRGGSQRLASNNRRVGTRRRAR